jgi:hypothetical protein
MATIKLNTTETTNKDNTNVVEPIISVKNTSINNNQTFMFDKQNYMYMLIGLGVIALGFMLMVGGKNPNPAIFDDAEIFSFRRITLAPFLVLLGFVIEGYAIMKKPSTN